MQKKVAEARPVRASLFFFVHALLLLLLLRVATGTESLTMTPAGCETTCGGMDIPYPFGIGTGCSRKGFEINCVNNNFPVLAGTSLRVVHLSVDPAESQVMLPVGWQCFNASDPSTIEDWRDGEMEMNKDGAYRISNTQNKLFVLGCNTMGYRENKRAEGGSFDSNNHYTGCMSYCNDDKSAQDGLCAGAGCCHVDIPPGLTNNEFNFRMYDHSTMMDYSPCDYAFLVGRTNYTFQRSDLFMDKNRTMPVFLDWAIRDNGSSAILSCADAAKADQYACVSTRSSCFNAKNGPGYNCKCSKGHQGNPYIVDGCTNIDECADKVKYPCYGVCEDTQGSYKCTCQPGYRSNDPRTEHCTPKFPLGAQISTGAIGGILVLVFLSFIYVVRKEQRKTKDFYDKNGGPTLENARNIKLFKKDDLKRILKRSNLVGKGGFGEVYKGIVDDVHVAVKKPIHGSVLASEQFANEVIIQSQVIHKNIVRLIGCCLEVDAPMLVYEFVSKGSLDDILHKVDNKEPLSLDVRVNIATESARGLSYMHAEAHTKILHGDVKPANILLDDKFLPKISDFGISRLIARENQHTGNIIGDMSYMDPVYLQKGLLTEKSDVYSFGVVILELITRQKASYSDNNSLVRNFLEVYEKEKKATELFDKEIAVEGDFELLDSLAGLSVECLNLDVNQRPTMADVAERLLILNRTRRP
ncbi:wall-associated receptor kinase 2 isoform X3 [Brachypodium distachyon]|nr:wall-associated receptor kinase 2 isoform X3 [Brachypodium distachyon]XP_014751406.1 wall-associated receptor kinase 2 isoform X3 [Brachypodium distachyon]XP_014751407.1 wall-associated receptor kinase 2 isoform X3 [Brachypodium distachyon]|eukprot:XP_014751405.1 wall-associated receptor kinase 2 isoform X3 [Brachypodium distachyon]